MSPEAAAARKPTHKTRRLRGRPRHGDIAALENNLLAAALDEFLRHGYGAASMTRIVARAGVSKTTLYSRFASKRDLFHALVQRQIEQISPSTVLGSQAGNCDLEEGLNLYANHMLEQNLKGDMLEVNRLIYSESSRFVELGAEAGARTELGIRRISDYIDACARAEGIPCNNARHAAEVFILMLRGWFINVMLTNRRVSAAQRRQWVKRSVRVLLASRADW